MTESTVESKVKGDWFEADVCVRIFLSYPCHHIVIEMLKFESLGHGWSQKERVSDWISDKRLIYKFVCNHIGISSESFSYFPPELDKLLMQI